jgi:hypothetical protein
MTPHVFPTLPQLPEDEMSSRGPRVKLPASF